MRRGLRLLLVSLVAFTALEVLVLWWLGTRVGFWPTVVFLVASATVGILAGKSQGLAVLRSWLDATADGYVPEEGLVDGLLVLLGSLLLVLPGVLGDVVGLALLVPRVRRNLAERIRRRAAGWVQAGSVQVFSPGDLRVEEPFFDDERREVIDVQGEVVEERPERLLP